MTVTKWFDSFKELYQTELVPREFDLIDNGAYLLLAKYFGSSPLRREDDGLVKIAKMLPDSVRPEDKPWRLEADDCFYANRAIISLGEEQRLPLGENCGRPSYWPGKVLRIDRLENGVEHLAREGTNLKFPFQSGDTLWDVHFEVSRKLIADLRREGYDISSHGFSPEESKLFGLTD
ncbi:MAG TPA: hypothetical protein VJA18_05400 [Candidatus Nanoarchaeia archaeon]|nr:hypothetical protein [Candidatus Nanoarchaeia archaeon]